MRLMARCVRGLEELLAEEIVRRGAGTPRAIGHREVHLDAPPGTDALALRIADDVFVLATEVDGVGTTRTDLRVLRRAVATADLDAVLRDRGLAGGRPTWAGVDVSASFLGRRSYTRYDIEEAVGTVLARRLRRPYVARRGGVRPPDGALAWRVTIDGGRATVAVRVADRPLHRRSYKVASIAGTLHPPVAAAMVALTAPEPGGTLLDPCCGAGTIAIEAAMSGRPHRGLRVLASDIDSTAVKAAAMNGHAAGIAVTRADAGALPVARGSVTAVALNPPWDRQVHPHGLVAREPERLWTELRRVLAPGGRVVALLHDVDPALGHAATAGLHAIRTLPLSLSGSHPTVVALG
ncbi:methyltransferase domain-containing protein [Actinomycetes bacterium KLBMP 9759]